MQIPRLILPLLVALAAAARAEVVINELMYHPQSENPAEEYIELFNNGAAAVDLSGWKFTSGVAFTIPAGTSIEPGGYLVIAASPATFHGKYPAVTNYISSAGWIGQLSNSSNNVMLTDTLSVVVDSVDYSDDGDWAERRRDNPPDFGHRGWGWHSDADGFGKSLELINAVFDNDEGQNWAASATAQGTPGAPNSVGTTDIAPVIDKADHFPLVPKSADNVSVTCRVRDDHAAALAVQLHYRNDGAASFIAAAMFDDGAHGDGLAGDGYFGATILPNLDGTIVEFYFTASDGALTRTWPAPARDYTGALVQTQNCLYQVDDTVYAGAMPIYRVVLLAADRTEVSNINSDTGTPPFPYNPGETNDQTYSHARFNATWITHDGTGDSIVYLAGVRNRGNGSRSLLPQSYNVAFRNSDAWKGVTALNLNTQNTPYQLLGSAIFRKAGLTMAESRAVQVRVNGANLAGSGAPSYGFYVANEVVNTDYADHHFPLDSSGNIYRGFRQDTVGGANLRDQSAGQPAATADPTPYRVNYFKETNESEDNWADLIGLTKTLSKGTSIAASYTATYTGDYVSAVQAAGDIEQWVRFLAVNTIADNSETNISNGDGDDYYLYFGVNDLRAVFISYDLDTIFGRSAGSNNASHSLFRAARGDTGGNPPTPLHPFLIHPQFAREYLAEVKRQVDGPFSAAQFAEIANETLGGVVSTSVINAMKTFHNARLAYIASVMPLSLSGINATTTGGTALTVTNGYPRSTAAVCNLLGKSDCTRTTSVKVNGVVATYTPWKVTTVSSFATSIGDWQANSVALTPGLNRVLVQAFDAANAEIERTYFDVWYDDTTVASVSGAIAANSTWTAAGGPYQVTAALTVNSGATLTIQAGTTVFLASGVGITVAAGGRILAEGTEAQPIRFTRAPGGTGNGGTITINGQAGTPETHFYYTYFEFGGDPAVVANANSNIVLDHCEWGRTDASYLHLDGGSFVVSNCIFPSATSTFELVHGAAVPPAGGRAIFRDSFFGKAEQYNDVVDFTGGNRPGTIVQFLNNIFIGTDDDILDLDGTDAWVEGNIFMHVHRNGAPDSSSAVSGGNDSGNTSQVTIVGNLFYDVDQAATAKQSNFYTFLQNTVVDQNGRGSQDTITGVLNFADAGIPEAAGMYAEGNIIHSATALVRNYPGTALQNTVTLNNNILPLGQAWTGLGSGNTNGDPVLANVQLVNANAPSGGAFNIPTPGPRDYQRVAEAIRTQFVLGAGSPAKGTGPNGSDKGGIRGLGVTLGGAPAGTTNETTASITVGTLMTGNSIPSAVGTFPNGSGWTHYKWRLNGGAWSVETVNSAPISLSGLTNGVKTLEVVGKNDAAYYQDDAAFGADAHISSVSWTVDTGYVPPAAAPLVQISEVLAKNSETLGFSGTFPDIIELRNAGTATADLSGWGLTDNAALPFKYTIASGTTLAPGARLTIYASNAGVVPAPKTGFGLKDTGDTLTLTKSAAVGGGIADSVAFGAQLADISVGRRESDGTWDMCRPTFGTANVVAAQSVPSGVKINEWLADAAALFPNDFIELMNTATLPVNVGNCYLSDNPVEWPQRHQIRQLTFIAPGSYLYLKADNDPEQGPDHLSFKLASEQGEIGFFDSALNLLDSIVYGPQTSDVSQGRTPNGAGTVAFFNQPTPGGPNPGVSGVTVTTTNLIPVNATWKYQASNTNLSSTFYATAFNDTGWPSGGQLIYTETSNLPSASGFVKTTPCPTDASNTNLPFQTTYFRRQFTYSGPLSGIALRATVMVDDGAVFYLNGQEIPNSRLRMPTGAVSFSTIASGNIDNAAEETLVLDSSLLAAGDNVLAVEVHQQHTGATQTSSDVVFGLKLDVDVTTSGGAGALVLNEVLPINSTLQNPDGSFVGWIELFNPTAAPISLADLSLSNEIDTPRKFVFPAGTTIAAGSYYVVQCNPLAAASATNTGFALTPEGGALLLFENLAAGGGLHDAISYGRQIADFGIGRTPNGTGAWALTVPTRAALNSPAATAALTNVKLNEWLTDPSAGADFFELFNAATQPVALGGNYLTDQLTNKTKHLIPTLSFIGGGGAARWQVWTADNVNAPGHATFTIEDGEALGLYTAAGFALDAQPLGISPVGQSRGRYTDGASAILALAPTPGGANVQAAPDADSDGLPDAYELANGLNPNDPADAAFDADGDGQNNRAEYVAGTNPQDVNDALRASLVRNAGTYAVRFTAVAGKTYTVQYKTALTGAPWIKLLDVPAQASTGPVDASDLAAIGQAQRFYRVITPQQ
jgi:Lamin Tail Domain/CotH kinase protein